MMKIFCELGRPQELERPSAFIQPEALMGTSEVPEFATAISKALQLPSLLPSKPVSGICSPQELDAEQTHVQLKAVFRKQGKK